LIASAMAVHHLISFRPESGFSTALLRQQANVSASSGGHPQNHFSVFNHDQFLFRQAALSRPVHMLSGLPQPSVDALMVFVMATKQKQKRAPGVEKMRVNSKLPPDLDDSLYEAAGKLGLTKSTYAEQAIREKLERDKTL
jgi:hypothetical protein